MLRVQGIRDIGCRVTGKLQGSVEPARRDDVGFEPKD